MANIELKITGVVCYANKTDTTISTKDITVSTENTEGTAFFKINTDLMEYKFSLVDLSIKKKMYQPTEIIADVQISMNNPSSNWYSLSRQVVEEAFKHKKVAASEGSNTIGDDYYIHEVLPCYQSTSMNVVLKIYSLDKLLTLKKVSRTYVSQKLGSEILSSELKNYKKPYDSDNTIVGNVEDMRVLSYTRAKKDSNNDEVKTEHIFPYLVQYNESFYDMLARTCNRWGEFLYYEDGNLHIGYPTMTPLGIGKYKRYFFDLDSKELTLSTKGKYENEAFDQNLSNTELSKSPNEVSGELGSLGTKADKYVMKKVASFFKNDKSLPTFIGNTLVDDLVSLGLKSAAVAVANYNFNKDYFPSSTKNVEHYGDGTKSSISDDTKYNQFTEIGSKYDEKKYLNILDKEQKAGKRVICIDYDTKYPNLKLGNLIEVDGENFIVVELSTRKETSINYSIEEKDNKPVVKATPSSSLVFQVIATSQNVVKDYDVVRDDKGNIEYETVQVLDEEGNVVKDSNGNPITETREKKAYQLLDTNYYPAVLPSGHVRYSDPQLATVIDADDPLGKNRVRVKFSWEGSDKDKESSSPWVTYATCAAGSTSVGKHYEGDKVLLGFVDGNIERPYVIGGIAKSGGASVVNETPGGHSFTLDDGTGAGLTKFVAGTLSPAFKMANDIVPEFDVFKNWDKSKFFEGGFELSDKYGIYSIKGSTDGRNVSVNSPWGDVNINAFTGISISAPNGDISIKGKNVKIEAGNNLELVSGTNVKYKLLGGDFGGFFDDLTAAVTKKLLDKALSIFTIDLSIVRSIVEIAFRPSEGKLLVKSNRYLMLESGKGECDYPATAYKDDATVQNLIKKHADKDIRPGLKLSSDVVKLFAKVNTIGNLIDSTYRERYNKCYEKYEEYKNALAAAKTLANDYGPSTCPNPSIVPNFDQLDKVFWADLPYVALKEEDLQFKNNYKVGDENDVDNSIANQQPNPDGKSLKDIKLQVIEKRKTQRGLILKAANELRYAICSFLCVQDVPKGLIMNQFDVFKDYSVPMAFREALVKAFDKDKLGDTLYFQKTFTGQKALTSKYDDHNSLQDHRKALKRKAAVRLLDEMGFKDEWRKQVPVRSVPGVVVAPVGSVPAAPPAPPAPLHPVPRVFDEADIIDANKWDDYVDSLNAVPKLSPVELKLVTEAKKSGESWAAGWNPFKGAWENRSWGDAKNGSILFSFNENIYDLKREISQVSAPWKENLTSDDDNDKHDVTSFLDGVRRIMKEFD